MKNTGYKITPFLIIVVWQFILGIDSLIISNINNTPFVFLVPIVVYTYFLLLLLEQYLLRKFGHYWIFIIIELIILIIVQIFIFGYTAFFTPCF